MSKIIRKTQIKEITGLSPRHIDRLEKAGKFPSRLQLGPKSVGWYEVDINKWLETRPRGPSIAPLTDTESNVVDLDELSN